MTFPKNAPRLLLGTALGALGGALFAWLHLPLPWMIGALVAVGAARLLGAPAEASRGARNVGMVVIGIALGLYFTPATAAVLVGHMPVLVLAAMATLVIGGGLAFLLARTAKVGMATAWFASLPGGAADMAMLAEAYGGRGAPVAIAQLLRVVCVVVLVPNVFALLGMQGTVPPIAASIPFAPGWFLVLYAVCFAAGFGLVRSGFKAGLMLGPLAITAALTAAGVTITGVPTWLSAAAQVLLGAQLGAGFDRATLLRLRRFVPAALLHVALLLLGCALAGLVLAEIMGEPIGAVLLGTAPGGVGEMSLTAKAMGQDVALVVTLHVTRIFLVALLTPPVFRLLQRHRGVPGGVPAAGD